MHFHLVLTCWWSHQGYQILRIVSRVVDSRLGLLWVITRRVHLGQMGIGSSVSPAWSSFLQRSGDQTDAAGELKKSQQTGRQAGRQGRRLRWTDGCSRPTSGLRSSVSVIKPLLTGTPTQSVCQPASQPTSQPLCGRQSDSHLLESYHS